MSVLKKFTQLFRKKTPVMDPDIFFPGLVTAKQFAAFKAKQRMQAVMIVGDSAEAKFYEFMKWCIE